MDKWWLTFTAVFTAIFALSVAQDVPPLEWIPMSDESVILEPGDDAATQVTSPVGFAFGGAIHHDIYVITNGLISFGSPYTFWFNQPFPGGLTNLFLIAPFWDDINTNDGGTISYEIHTSGDTLDLVSQYVSQKIDTTFEGYWMMVVFWDSVPPFSFFTSSDEVNSFQAVLIMDSNQNTYAIFIYECGLMQWDNFATIGYNAGPDHYDNHDPSSSAVACVNYPANNFSNVFYQLHEAEPLPTEPAQSSYLDFFGHTMTTINSGYLPSCDDCISDAITLPGDFPFGNYYHQTAYVASNGHISFLTQYTHFNAELFPTTNPSIYWDFVSAPFWSDVDLRLEGSASWEIHTTAQSPDLIDTVSAFIRDNYNGSGDFQGEWMMIGYWEDVHPFPHGFGIETPYTLSANTFQAILITNGIKSYAVYTYKCGEMEWGDESTIGFNAGGEYLANHPITGHFQSHFIACLQNISNGNLIKNEIYDLVPDPDSLIDDVVPPIHPTIGSCQDAGFTECCSEGDCRGLPFLGSCYCDALCGDRGDCCYDQQYICPTGLLTDNYLIVAEDTSILHMSLNGSDLDTLNSDINGRAYGIDYNLATGVMVWSDVERDIIYKKNLNGTGLVSTIVRTNIEAVDDVAIDWIGNNLYWTDAVWARIEVMNLDTLYRTEVLRTGANTNPRAIAVDPTTRYMYWAELGEHVMIERAYLDGNGRQILIGFGVAQPNGLTIDIEAQRLYWCDTGLGTIAYGDITSVGVPAINTLTINDGTLNQPFSLTLSETSVFWTDWGTNSVYSTHKDHGNDEDDGHFFTVYTSSPGATPRGLEVVSSNQQPTDGILNPCNGSGCSHICMLSRNTAGFTCACPENYVLDSDGVTCQMVNTPSPTPPPEGSCLDQGYVTCCSHGSCAGNPPTCFCDEGCYQRFDCCYDLQDICTEVPPVPAADISVVLTSDTATVTFTIPFVVHDDEQYQIRYGTSPTNLDLSSLPTNSEANDNVEYEISIPNLLPGTIYYFQLSATNSIGTTLSGIFSGITLETAPSGPPENFDIVVDGNSLVLSWQPPPSELRNGIIVSYTLSCNLLDDLNLNPILQFNLYDLNPNTEYFCQIAASTAVGIGPFTAFLTATTEAGTDGELTIFRWTIMGAIYGTNQVFLPPTDDGFVGPIDIVPGFPFGSSIQTQVFIGTNGLISFGVGYNSFSNQAFPGNALIQSRYLVAPFWDDVDIRFNTGDISYEIHESGYYLNQVNTFIQKTRPTSFEGTWMMVVFYDAVHPFFGLFNPNENTFQAILITDGTYSYTIFTYQCGLMEWDNGATIGFNAAGEIFANHNPSSSEVACLNSPDSDWSNVIFRLSTNNSESPSPSNVEALNITLNSTIIQWMVASISEQQQYTVSYGIDPSGLGMSTDPITSTDDILQTDLLFQQSLEDLQQGTTYYVQVVATYGIYTLTSDVISFTTLEPAIESSPLDFAAVASGTAVTFTWSPPLVDQVIVSYFLSCNSGDVEVEIQAITSLTLYDLPPETTFSCTLAGASSGGYGPASPSISVTTEDALEADSYFSFIPMDIHVGVQQLFFPGTDDGFFGPIVIPGGFPFGDSVQNEVYIGSNGILSFGGPYNPFLNQELPVPDVYLVAPYWDDIDTRFGSGQISFEIHQSGYFLEEVSEFIRRRRSAVTFTGTWMLIVYWDAVHPFFGLFSTEENTFQAIVITDGTYSYSLFTYNCALTEWDNGVTIGFSDGGDMYDTFNPSSSEVACLNLPASNFSNIIYLLSAASPEIPPPHMVTISDITETEARISWNIPSFTEQEEYVVEYGLSATALDLESDTVLSITDTSVNFYHYNVTLEGLSIGTQYYFRVVARFGTGDVYIRSTEIFSFLTHFEPQADYLEFFEHTDTAIDSDTLISCDDCSSLEISLPTEFPFGGYFHRSVYVSTNGYITFGVPLITSEPEELPPIDGDTFWTYLIAPFWADFDTTMGGTVSYEVHDRQNSPTLVETVDSFIANEYGDSNFEGNWILVAFWENVEPSGSTDGNTFQAVLTTNGTKSYGVFIYHCGDLSWSDAATIGFNAPLTAAFTHPLSTTIAGASVHISSDEIACIHHGSEWNNIILELEDSNHILETTPEPHFSTGSCVDAGHTGCCTGFPCFVQPGFCWCDAACHFFQDCCYDIDEICPATDGSSYDILVGHGDHISQVHFEGTSSETVRTDTTGTVVGVDYLFSESQMFWSDLTTDTIHRANLDGSGEAILVDSCISTVDDIAVDWISYKLYWVDSTWARIEAMDLNTSIRVEVLATGANTIPRAIAVDPMNRVMFWTDYGVTAKIETAGMDGSERRVLHFSDLSQPNGITIDYNTGRIYWSDSDLDRLEYSSFDGSDRTILESGILGLVHPFAVTVADTLLFWSDWSTNKVYATHSEHGTSGDEGHFVEIVTFVDRPYGIEALRADRQPPGINPCLVSECSHMCLLTFVNVAGFSCACPEGYEFENATFCKPEEGTPTACSITPGSCAAYSSCCEEGFCAGSPATCFCDPDCRLRDDCCSDINDTCIEGFPRLPRSITVTHDEQTATISWRIPYITSPEMYTVQYGLNSDDLSTSNDTISSGTNTSITNQEYSVTLEELLYVTTYYFKVVVTNDVGSVETEVLSFTTPEGAPSGPPSVFDVSLDNTMICLSWNPPSEGRQNGVIISYTITCSRNSDPFSQTVKGHIRDYCIDFRRGGEQFNCSIAASTAVGAGPSTNTISVTTEGTGSAYFQFVSVNSTYGVDQVFLPESDDGTFGPISLPEYGFPFWSTSHTEAYIAVNGLISFDQPFGFFFNVPFPGFVGSLYLVAPFWDDANIVGGGGQISYEVHESGYLLDHVSAYLRAQRPSEFQGTWMLIVFYDAVHPFFGAGENTYQVILITDGTVTYTIFTYDCNLLEWGTTATIGFNAGGEAFENNEYTSNAIACSSLPDSDITNVIYRLSEENTEYVLPQNLVVDNIQLTSVTVNWVVPSVTEQQQYRVAYGLDPQTLDQMSSVVPGVSDITLTDQEYSVNITGLTMSTNYYFRIVVTFGDQTIMSELSSFRTLDQPPTGPPTVNFTVEGVNVSLSWNHAPVINSIILSYTLTCNVEGDEALRVVLKPIQEFLLEELNSSTTYTCSMFGSTSGGDGPSANFDFITDDVEAEVIVLPFIVMNALLGVEQTIFPTSDEGTNGPLPLDIGFPFGSSFQTQAYVATNGLLSFDTSYGSFFNQPFPGSFAIFNRYLVAPFWDDVDTRFDGGEISYEVHESGYFLNRVNSFLRRSRPSRFEGTWMMVAYWDAVNPYFGLFSSEINSFQAILITDGVYSYTIFTYKCGLMEWGSSPTIGYNAAGESYANHDPSSPAIACLNSPDSDYYNVIYLLSNDSPEFALPQDVTATGITTNSATISWRIPTLEEQEEYYVLYGKDPENLDQATGSIPSLSDTSIINSTYSLVVTGLESGVVYYAQVVAAFDVFERFSEATVFLTKAPGQAVYLQFLPPGVTTTTLESCDDCTSAEITFPDNFPFGGYFHRSAYVSTNGLVSFGRSVTVSDPVLFPGSSAIIAHSYIVAPYWADFDTTSDGSVSWWIEEEGSVSLGLVTDFIQSQFGDEDFTATWMLVADWEDVQAADTINSFQVVLVTNGAKSYAVYTYRCGELMWSGPTTIGLNTPEDIVINHTLSGTPVINDIACIHQDSEWSNLIYDLEINPIILPLTPAPSPYLGSCVAAGFTDCCEGFFFCLAPPFFDCWCDVSCHLFGDCCFDITETCPMATEPLIDALLVGHGHHISQIHFEGTSTETLRTNTTGTVVGIDYHYLESKMYWSDVTTDTIHIANIDGTEELVLVDDNLIAVDDIAFDWVSGKLYWTDAGWARIEAMDLDTLIRVELIRTGTNTAPRAIAVDPIRRVMYWTDWGRTAKIEIASMDGSERRDFVITELSQPNGIAIDLDSERVYWSDSDLDKLEFIGFDGSGRMSVETESTGLLHPFAVTIAGDLLFWSDWATNSIYATHKQHGADDDNGHFAIIASFPSTPYGLEAYLLDRQPFDENPCYNNTCSHVCLLSETSLDGFTCACPIGYYLDTPTLCKVTGDTATPTPPPDGTCAGADYEYCCEHGFCAGYPASCYCDADCFQREDCCADISDICADGSPRAPTDITVTDIMGTSARIRWIIPYITSTQESYYVTYGLNPSSLTLVSPSHTSGPNISTAYSQLLIGLDPSETYYFRVIASNDVGMSGSDIYSFMTLSGPPTGPPLDFDAELDGTAMTFIWSPPDPPLQNGVILSYTLSCLAGADTTSVVTTQLQFTFNLFIPGETFRCAVYATNPFGDGPPTDDLIITTEGVQAGTLAYLPLLELGLNRVLLPEGDDGPASDAIPLPAFGFPFWNTNRSVVYVGINGLLSFDSPYDSWFNNLFPGFVANRYLVAPFWDDALTTLDRGDMFYEVYESGYMLDYISAFIRRRNPSEFQGTWMMVASWEAVHQYTFFFPGTEENTYQAILITDGTFTYTIFTYDCNLLEWGTSATIGFNAGGEAFENNEYTSNAIACSSLPDSNITNVIYRLSSADPEYPRPQNVQLDIGLITVTVTWEVPYIHTLQLYSIVYGVEPDVLNRTWGLVYSSQGVTQYSITVQGLTTGTDYYLRVSSTFGYSVLYSDLIPFLTLDPPPTGPPLNFSIDVIGTTLDLTWQQPAEELRNGVIRFYTLTCSSQGVVFFDHTLTSVLGIALDDFRISTDYKCDIYASTSGGRGPSTNASATTGVVEDIYLPLIPTGNITDIGYVQLPDEDDETSDPITIPPFPFGNSIQTTVFVGTNGLLSFNNSYNPFFNNPFSEFSSPDYLIAPFWADVDIRGGNGRIFYEIHESGYFLDQVNTFLQRKRPSSFEGTWMLVAHWDAVRPYFGLSNPEENTFQAILITDGIYSYTILSYKCGLLEWDGAVVGFKADGDFFENVDPDVDCLNSPKSEYSNLIFLLSNESPEIPLPDMVTASTSTDSATVNWRIPSFTTQEEYYVLYGTDPTDLDRRTARISSSAGTSLTNQMFSLLIDGLDPGTVYYLRVVAVFDVLSKRESETIVIWTKENEQAFYLEFLERSDSATYSGIVEPCTDGCSSSEIVFPYNFPFGGYFHQRAFVNTDGVITFGQPLEVSSPELFPTSFWSYLVAPLWVNINTNTTGSVSWEIYDNSNHSELLALVDQLIQQEQMDTDFNGLWMLVATWENVELDNSTSSTFQAILTTNGVKSYSIFTYNCEQIQWSGPAIIGYNAPPATYYNHPLTLTSLPVSTLACSHLVSPWNNVIIDLQPTNVILPGTPSPSQFQGSCRAAGYTDCCVFSSTTDCIGTPVGSPPCYCDFFCIFFGDCCFDADHTCTAPTYDLLVGNGNHLSLVHFEGTVSETVRSETTGNVVGVDFHAARSLMFWSDTMTHTIHQANMNGENEIILVDTNIRGVDDIAVDWIANNLYWIDSVWARIEALSLDSMERAEILRAGINTRPRAIAVDPINKVMFWTDWGQTAKIERAFLDGEERRTVHTAGLSQPNGITIDYATQKIYWSDSDLDKLEYSNYDGSERTILETAADGLYHPFALSIVDDLLFWTDWETNYLYYTHKEHGDTDGLGVFQPLAHFTSTPYGVEALSDSRQMQDENPCADSGCGHICLLSATNDAGYVCGCAQGAGLQDDGKTCDTTTIEPMEGSCMEAGYDSCCAHGFCAGYPATCSCNPDCHDFGDCCSDIDTVCPAVSPELPIEIELTYLTHISAEFQWSVPRIVFSPELYTFMYSTTPDDVNTMMTEPQFSGTDTTLTDQVYTVRLEDLVPGTTYYYQIKVENTVGITLTEVLTFNTPFVGPPQNFIITVDGSETLTFSWGLPLEIEEDEIDYYVIECMPHFQHAISEIVLDSQTVTLEEFLPGTTYTCTVAAKGDELGAPARQTATTEEAPSVLPFLILGTTEGVERTVLPASDDANSAPIYISGGLPLGSTTHTIAHVGTNGIISFGQEWSFWNPDLFPTGNYYIHTSYVAAPFWADIDTRSAGSVSYEVHERGFNEDSNKVLERISGFISAQMNVNFTATWMLLALWDRVHPFPHGSMEIVSEYYANFLESENTFQAVVITDGMQNFVMYTYQCDLMEWPGEGIGYYATIGYNLNGAYLNHPLSGTEVVHNIACQSNVTVEGISRREVSAMWYNQLYQLPSAVDPIQQERSECLTMRILDIQTVGDIQPLSSSLGACPNSVAQAILDFRFAYHSQSSTLTSRCYVHVFPAGANDISSLICCYSIESSIAGALLVEGIQGSSIALYHPVHFSELYDDFDKEFKEKCCSSGLCHVFYERRPIDNSVGYLPPFFGFVNGDPHLTTLDGTLYTFNGRGEYTLVKALNTGFSLQGRTEPVSNSSNATQFSSFAIGIKQEGLSAEIRSSRGRLVTYVNGEDVSSSIEMVGNSSVQGNNAFYLNRSGENSVRVLLYKNGIAYILSVSLRGDILDFVINLEEPLRGNTRGLLGNFNGDNTDDFIMSNGIPVPSNASDMTIHDFGQSWQILEEESLFTYPSGMSHSHYTFPDHIPPYLSEVVANAPDNIKAMCNDNPQCIFDAVQTNDPAVGTGTLSNIETNNDDVLTANNFPPNIDGPESFRVNIGQTSTYTFTVTDEDESVDVTVQGPSTQSLTQNGNTYTFSWTVSEVNVQITFVATDSMNGVSTLSPLIEVCACQNNGNCTLEGVLGIEENIIDMRCECTPAWGGRYCENDVDGCSELICFEGVQCYDVVAPGYGAICGPCPDGYQGDGEKCTDVDECNSTTPCQQVCINTPGSYMCSCRQGYQMIDGSRTDCEDVNECDLLIHDCQQECSNTQGSFTCSCPRPGYELGNDGKSCNASNPCGDSSVCGDNSFCAMVDGNPICSCEIGFNLASDGRNCLDINECEGDTNVCESSCSNTVGSFECGCKAGYTLSSNGRTCIDMNECVGTVSLCSAGKVCNNTDGSYSCVCPLGTMENDQNVCVPAEITPPPVVTVPTDKPDPDNIGKDNSINVTLIYSKDEFDMSAQLKFKTNVASAITDYCAVYSRECGGPFVIAVGDVVLSDITNNAKNQATFTMYVYIKDRTDALDRKILAIIVSDLPDVATAKPIVSESESESGLSGGAVAGIVISILVVVAAVILVAAIMLFKMRRGGMKFRQMTDLTMANIFRSRGHRSSMLIEENVYESEAASMKDTTSISGEAEAKEKEASAEQGAEQRGGEVGDEEKVDLTMAEETIMAEETL